MTQSNQAFKFPTDYVTTFDSTGGSGDLLNHPVVHYKEKADLVNREASNSTSAFKNGEESALLEYKDFASKKIAEVIITNKKLSDWNLPRERILQEWEGQVSSVHTDEGVFFANLTDKTAKENFETEVGEFAISDLSDSDLELLEDGAIFCWIIGRRYVGTQCERFSRVNFRRLPVWNAEEIITANKEAERLNAIRWD